MDKRCAGKAPDWPIGTLRSDCSLLSDISRSFDVAKRIYVGTGGASRKRPRPESRDEPLHPLLQGPMVRTRRGEEAASDPGNDGNELAAAQRGLPRHLQNLVRVASDHGVRLHILPQGMTRRRLNTSTVDVKHSSIKWRVELDFFESVPTTGGMAPRFVERVVFPRVDESKSLLELLDQTLSLDPSNAPRKSRLRGFAKLHYARDGKTQSQSEGLDECKISFMLQDVRSPANGKTWKQLPAEQSLR